jgi:hypothetical protein
LGSAFFFISAIPIFWSIQINGTPVRFLIWVVPLVLVWAERVHRRRLIND